MKLEDNVIALANHVNGLGVHIERTNDLVAESLEQLEQHQVSFDERLSALEDK